MNINIINIKTRDANELGKLSFFESSKDIPFEIKRIYYTYDAPKGTQRGGHAHKKLQQVLFCPYGMIEVILNDSVNRESIMLDNPSKALLVGPGLWRDIIWHTENAVLCVAASEYYDENDYIRDYNEYLNYKALSVEV